MTGIGDSEQDRVRERWLEAAKVLSLQSEATVPCPVCAEATLQVLDVPFPGGLDRYIHCPLCGAKNVLQLRRPP